MNREWIAGLAWGGGIVALALGATLARKLGHMDAETVTRLVIGANGLMVAWYGNRMPKAVFATAWAQRVARVGGWCMTAGGLAYAGLWAFAPMPFAIWGGCAVFALAIVIMFGYCFSQYRESRAGRAPDRS